MHTTPLIMRLVVLLLCLTAYARTAPASDHVPFAIASMVMTPDYQPAFLALHQSIGQHIREPCPCYVFIPENQITLFHVLHRYEQWSRNQTHPVHLIEITLWRTPHVDSDAPSRFSHTFSKLQLFNASLYPNHVERVVYLDADTLIVNDCAQHLLISNAIREPAFVPDILLPDTFNTGVMVFNPSTKFAELLWMDYARHVLDWITDDLWDYSYDGGDQGVLNRILAARWMSDPSQSFGVSGFDARHRLPFRYNALLYAAQLHAKEWARAETQGICVVHFSGQMGKPFSAKLKPEVKRAVQNNVYARKYYDLWYKMYGENLFSPKPFSHINYL